MTSPGSSRRQFWGFRRTASTGPDEVRTQQSAPLGAGGTSFAVSPVEVGVALSGLDADFRRLGYPRSGLYTVDCEGQVSNIETGVDAQVGPRCSFGTFPFFGPLVGLAVGSGTFSSRFSRPDPQTGGTAVDLATLSARSTLAYFIPAAPTGQRVQRARLSAFGFAVGNPASDVRLNGKAPLAIFPPCTSTLCWFVATWDFTTEARALAAQKGGGLLQLTVDPVPPRIDRRVFAPDIVSEEQNGSVTLWVDVNYPWRHGIEGNALTLTFEADCPKELTLIVTPSELRPRMPRDQVQAAGLTTIGTTAEVTVRAKACPAPGETPAPVDVALEVQPPAVDNDTENGGHLHTSLNSARRLTGTFLDYYYNGGQTTASCRIGTFVEGVGTCTVKYFTRDMSGVETLVATAADYPEAEAQVKVRVPALEPLPANPSQYVLVGAPSSQDPCPGRSVSSRHERNHYGRVTTIATVEAIAQKLVEDTKILPRINDMSLPWGGIFDINNNWVNPHNTHRTGRDFDIGFEGVQDGVCTAYSRTRLFEAIFTVTKRVPREEKDAGHFHGSIPR